MKTSKGKTDNSPDIVPVIGNDTGVVQPGVNTPTKVTTKVTKPKAGSGKGAGKTPTPKPKTKQTKTKKNINPKACGDCKFTHGMSICKSCILYKG